MARSKRIVLLAVAVLVAWSLTSGVAAAKDPLVGSWQLNLERCTFDPGPIPPGGQRRIIRG